MLVSIVGFKGHLSIVGIGFVLVVLSIWKSCWLNVTHTIEGIRSIRSGLA